MNKATIIAIIGPLVTIITLGSTLIYTQGAISERITTAEEGVNDNRKRIMTNRNKQVEQEVMISKVDTKLDMVIKMLEDM